MNDLTHKDLAEKIDHLDARVDRMESRLSTFEARIEGDIQKIERNTQPIVEIVATLNSIKKFAAWAGTIVGALVAITALFEMLR